MSDSGSESEICDSKKDLERQFGVKVDDFVFPAGHVDGYADEWLKNCGYSRAFLTKPGKIDRKELLANPYSLPRLRVTAKTDMRSLIFGSGAVQTGTGAMTGSGTLPKREKHLQAR